MVKKRQREARKAGWDKGTAERLERVEWKGRTVAERGRGAGRSYRGKWYKRETEREREDEEVAVEEGEGDRGNNEEGEEQNRDPYERMKR